MTELPIEQIRIDGGTQPREALNEEHVERCREGVESGQEIPDPVVYYDGKDYWLADGFHRREGHVRAGKKTMLVEVRQGTRREAVLYSVGANAEHSALPRSAADKRRAVETLLRDEEWGQWNDSEIARRCNVAQSFVHKVRGKLSYLGDKIAAPPERKVKRGNTEYTMKTPARKSKAAPQEPEQEETPVPTLPLEVASPAVASSTLIPVPEQVDGKGQWRRVVLGVLSDGQWWFGRQILEKVREKYPDATRSQVFEGLRRIEERPLGKGEGEASIPEHKLEIQILDGPKSAKEDRQYRLYRLGDWAERVTPYAIKTAHEGLLQLAKQLEDMSKMGWAQIPPHGLQLVATKIKRLLADLSAGDN